MRDNFWSKNRSYAKPELAGFPWKPTDAGSKFYRLIIMRYRFDFSTDWMCPLSSMCVHSASSL